MDFGSPHMVMMAGRAGVGKSTLAKLLRSAIGDAELLPEEAIFEFPEFAEVGNAFRMREWPTPDMMLDAYRRFFQRVRGNWVIADWSALGMIEDLPCAQHDRTTLTTRMPDARVDFNVLTTHARDVLDAAGVPGVLLALEAAEPIPWRRAAAERGDEWLAKQMEYLWPLAGETLEECIVRDAAAWHRRRQDIVRAHEVGGWSVVSLDVTAPPDVVFAQALFHLSRLWA